MGNEYIYAVVEYTDDGPGPLDSLWVNYARAVERRDKLRAELACNDCYEVETFILNEPDGGIA